MSPVIPGLMATAFVWRVLLTAALLGTLTSTIFLLLVLAAAVRYRQRAQAARRHAATVPQASLPKVTVLKPVHGMEPRLEQNLESFFQQDYPDFEIIFGARQADNAALQIAEKVRARYPHIKSRIVISGMPTWPNAKVFSLDRMIATSSNDYLVISDSDVEVAPDFLRNVIPPLLDRNLGLVPCLI